VNPVPQQVRLTFRASLAAAAALVLASCGSGSSSSPTDDGSGSASPPHTIATGSETAAPSPSESSLGSPEQPVAATPVRELLDWEPVPGSTKALVTVGDGWTLTVPAGAASARLRGPHPRTIPAGPHSSVTDAFLDDSHALVVSEDRLAQDPDRAVLVDLASGRTRTLDQHSDPPTVVGGTWALGPDTLVHATSSDRRHYCLATVGLADGRGTTGWCAAPRHGFRGAIITEDATSMLTFDDHHPSCRTPVQVSGTDLAPFPGVPDCKGWDAAVLDGTTIWSVVRNEHHIEVGHFYAHTDAGWFDLGSGATGSLVTCAGSAFFSHDPDSHTDPATLMRWSPGDHRLTVAYQTTSTGKAFLSPPRCGGSHLTVTAYSQGGDEQVTAGLG
jgi:hypothetical protein